MLKSGILYLKVFTRDVNNLEILVQCLHLGVLGVGDRWKISELRCDVDYLCVIGVMTSLGGRVEVLAKGGRYA